MGAFGMPEIYVEQKMAHEHALVNSRPIIEKGWEELAQVTGRKYSAVELYETEGAETLILSMGSIGETASLAVDAMRAEGKKVGLVKLRLWRPFPAEDLRKALGGAKDVVVLDRAIALGAGNAPVTSEIRAIMYHEPQRPKVHCMIAGIGQRDVTPEDVVKMVEMALAEKTFDYHIYGVRG
jgi:pyruvate ferredoxin oxidoreductase alpha subunit